MSPIRTVTIAAAAALIAGAAYAQEAPAAPSEEAAVATDAAVEGEAAVEIPAEPPTAAALAYRPVAGAVATGDLATTLAAGGQFSKFLAAAEKTNLMALLKGDRPLTLLVPTDAAFDALPPGRLDAMMAAQPATELQGLLVKHIIATKIAPEQVDGAKGPVPTAAQTNVLIDGSVDPMKVDSAVVLQKNIPATNGVIYVIDRLL